METLDVILSIDRVSHYQPEKTATVTFVVAGGCLNETKIAVEIEHPGDSLTEIRKAAGATLLQELRSLAAQAAAYASGERPR